MVGVQKKLLQTPGIPKNVFRDVRQGTMPFIHVFNLSITSLEDRNAAEHCEKDALTGPRAGLVPSSQNI